MFRLVAPHAVAAPRYTPLVAPLSRSVKTLAGDLRKGNLIIHKNKLAKIIDIHSSMGGRGTPSMEITCDEMKRAPNASKFARHIIRSRPLEKLEKATMHLTEYDYLYHDDNIVHLMNPDTFEQIEVSRDAAPPQVTYLSGGERVVVYTCAVSRG